MPKVFLGRDRFHKDINCPRLTRSNQHPEVDLEDIGKRRPCAWCYPDAPRVDYTKKYCKQCASPRACEHNGGIQVIVRHYYTKHDLVNAPGDWWEQRHWVWPDRARFYRTVDNP